MTKLANMLAMVVVPAVVFFGASARAVAAEEPATAVAEPAASDFPARPWAVRAEWTMLDARSTSFVPYAATGVTVGRFVASRLAVEGTLMDGTESSWLAMANARWEPLRTRGGGHALTLAGGPQVLLNNGVHGDTVLAHAELAYVYRAPFGLTALVGFGANLSLTDSSYVAPDPDSCWLGCTQELHRGDILRQVRAAVGWTF